MVTRGQVTAAYRTDTGQVREHNEDFVVLREPVDSEDAAQNGWLCVVADGVGGADAGEIASKYTAERTIFHYLNGEVNQDWGKRLQAAIMKAHHDLCTVIEDRQDSRRMGTTIVAAVLVDEIVVFANVGDSRGYHCRNGEMKQITKDHSLVVKLLDEGVITQQEAKELNIGNIILQSIGSEHPPKVDLFPTPVREGDKFLLCSDGLTTHVTDEEIAQILGQDTPDKAVDKLIKLANDRGGYDNISVLVMCYGLSKPASPN